MCIAPIPSAARHNIDQLAAGAPLHNEVHAPLQRCTAFQQCMVRLASCAAPSELRVMAARLPMSYTPSTIGSTLKVRLATTCTPGFKVTRCARLVAGLSCCSSRDCAKGQGF
jgi:hypothetical protein